MTRLWIFVCLFGYICIAMAQSTGAKPNSKKKFLNITVMEHAPSVVKGADGEYVGFIPDVLEMLAERLNFDYSMYQPADERFGRFNRTDGTWIGMMAEVVDGRADIAIPLTITHLRSQYVDFTFPLQSSDPAIVLRRPEKRSLTVMEGLVRLLVPMEFPVWLMVCLAFLVTSTILYIISHTNPYEWRRMAKDKEATLREAESFTCLNSFWFIISTLAWQGYVRAPRSMGGRITVTAWWFFVLIFLLAYTASLTNYLRVGPAPHEAKGYSSIQSFKDLADNKDVTVGMISGGSTSQNLKASPLPEDKKLYQKFAEYQKKKGEISSYREGVKSVREQPFHDFAFIMESPSAKYEVSAPPCDLYMVSDPRSSKFVSMALRKNSPLLGDINEEILKLYESGTLTMVEKRWFEDSFEKKCEQSVIEHAFSRYEEPTFYQLDLGTFSGALLILVVGLVLGGFVTLIEYCIFKWAESHPDEDEVPTENQVSQNDLATSEQLLPTMTKKGGATQV